MIAVDTGVFSALADARDKWHARAVARMDTQTEGWVTSWAVLTEAAYLLTVRLGPEFSARLMYDVAEGNLAIWTPGAVAVRRIPQLLRRYAKLPMDLADATMVLLAEHLRHGRILSTDERDFGAYRWKQHEPFYNLLI